MKRILKMGIVLMFMVILLTGCTNTDYNVEVKRNGSGTVGYSVEFDENVLNNQYKVGIQWMESFEFFNNIMKNAEDKGYTIEKKEKDGGVYGFSATKNFDDIKSLNIQESIGDDYAKILEDTGVQIEKNFFVTKYTQSYKVDLETAGETINKVKISYKFPKGIVKSNADEKSSIFNSNLTWNLGNKDVKTIQYTVYSFNIPLLVIILLVIVLIIVAVIFFIKKSKKNKEENDKLAGKNKKQ